MKNNFIILNIFIGSNVIYIDFYFIDHLPVFWYLYFKRTSGARNPGVPARGAFISGLFIQTLQTFNLPTQSHVRRCTLGTVKLFFSYLQKAQ